MSLVVHKFPLEYGITKLSLPQDATVQSVGAQENGCFIWICYDPNPLGASLPRRYLLVNTGDLIEYDRSLFNPLGSIMTHNGKYIYHIFEVLQ